MTHLHALRNLWTAFNPNFDFCRYILYVSAVDQSSAVEDRRTSMAIVEVRIQGAIEDRPKREPEKLPQEILATSSGEENQLKTNTTTEEQLAEAKRKVLLNV